MSCASSGYSGINVLRFDDRIFIIFMYDRFFGRNKMGSHLYGFCSQHKCCRNSSSICDSSGCDYRNLHCVYNLWNQYHSRIFSDVSSGFTSFRNNCICPAPFHSSCKCNGCNHRNDFNSCFFPHFHIFFRASGACRYNLYAFLRYYFCHVLCIRTHQHDIYSKWFISQLFCFSDLFTYPLSRGACSPDEPKPAGI